ncbi:MAG: preprotein translocase subunit SecY, partial [Bdellovibrionales bacterium]|nr:preprotein translocase subunit SecY [Bdellovibrionales bacterium]
DPEKVAENLKKQGGFIPTRRPGKETAEFINDVLTRLTFWGSIYVVIICLVPDMVYRRLGAGSFSYFFGGTAVLIVVGVVLDTAAQLESHVVARNYEGFMNKSPGKIRGQSRATAVRGRLIQR